MTEQPDTAAIRARYDVYLDVPGNQVIRALCDSLDAAREIIALADSRVTSLGRELDKCVVHEREERARANREQHRAETADARIAKAVAAYRRGLAPGDTESAMYEALTEETP